MTQLAPQTSPEKNRTLFDRFKAVRNFSEKICEPLEIEDYVIQSMPDVSPIKWHLAHTTWFFETFVLKPLLPDYRPFHPSYEYLFNSYYNAVGEQFPRPRRGLLSRPTVAEVFEYRRFVEERMTEHWENLLSEHGDEIAPVIEIGIHHEQQHQELMFTDLKHVFATNPLNPIYSKAPNFPSSQIPAHAWIARQGGLIWIGHEGEDFAYDNETPRHQTFLQSFEIGNRLVTCGEYLEFMEDGGYRRPEFWLSEGWATVQEKGWEAPLYWHRNGEGWDIFTLSGLRPVDPSEPVCHVSYFEADAFAQWAGGRLPGEAEWEHVAADLETEGNFVETGKLHPSASGHDENAEIHQMFGDVWEWTRSPYVPYPGYRQAEGALGEYNGKFMCNQLVLRGGSCVTSGTHIRPTYRNFFPPEARWQFSGIRMARDL